MAEVWDWHSSNANPHKRKIIIVSNVEVVKNEEGLTYSLHIIKDGDMRMKELEIILSEAELLLLLAKINNLLDA